jgi:hypothetical protein
MRILHVVPTYLPAVRPRSLTRTLIRLLRDQPEIRSALLSTRVGGGAVSILQKYGSRRLMASIRHKLTGRREHGTPRSPFPRPPVCPCGCLLSTSWISQRKPLATVAQRPNGSWRMCPATRSLRPCRGSRLGLNGVVSSGTRAEVVDAKLVRGSVARAEMSLMQDVIIIEPGQREGRYWLDLWWRYRELFRVLAWRAARSLTQPVEKNVQGNMPAKTINA